MAGSTFLRLKAAIHCCSAYFSTPEVHKILHICSTFDVKLDSGMPAQSGSADLVKSKSFHELATSGQPFTSEDYMLPTPSWAVFGAAEAGLTQLRCAGHAARLLDKVPTRKTTKDETTKDETVRQAAVCQQGMRRMQCDGQKRCSSKSPAVGSESSIEMAGTM
eukprot:1146035-Pelagomonas_calceolata.AAC.1